MGVHLGAAVRQAVPLAAVEVLRELERLGRPAVRRATPCAPDVWWEAAPSEAAVTTA